MEAMASGLPVVSTNIVGISELIENNVHGFLVPQKNAECLSEKILYLLENRQQAESMGENGKKRIAQDFDLRKNVTAFFKLMRNSIEK